MLRKTTECIDYRSFYINHRTDDRIRDIIQVEQPFYIRRRKALVDEMMHHTPFIRHQRHFRPTISLVNTEVHPYTILVYKNRLMDFFGVFSNSCG